MPCSDLLTSGPLGASAVIAERSAQDGTCSRGVCESAVWLRTPLRFQLQIRSVKDGFLIIK